MVFTMDYLKEGTTVLILVQYSVSYQSDATSILLSIDSFKTPLINTGTFWTISVFSFAHVFQSLMFYTSTLIILIFGLPFFGQGQY